jgi:hypothetical protein
MSGYVRELDRDADDKANGIETIQINHYESGGFPAGSVAVLKDGRRLVTESTFIQLWEGFIASKKANVRPQDASTVEMAPCPFCKGTTRIESTPMYPMVSDDEAETPTEKQFYVVCNSCAAQGPWVKNSSAGAIRMWNMRTL